MLIFNNGSRETSFMNLPDLFYDLFWLIGSPEPYFET